MKTADELAIEKLQSTIRWLCTALAQDDKSMNELGRDLCTARQEITQLVQENTRLRKALSEEQQRSAYLDELAMPDAYLR